MTESIPEMTRPLTLEYLLRFKRNRKASLALKIVRVLVGLEYGSVVAAYLVILWEASSFRNPETWLFILFGICVGGVYYCLCGFGITMMGWGMETVDNEAPLELWAFIAIGVAPIAAILYMAIADYLLGSFSPTKGFDSPLLIVVPIVGYYSSFILPTYWLRYQYREDEF